MRLRVQRRTVPRTDWTASPLKIAVLSDLHGHLRENGRDLVVSGEIGCSILPVRFGMVPDITLVTVSNGNADKAG